MAAKGRNRDSNCRSSFESSCRRRCRGEVEVEVEVVVVVVVVVEVEIRSEAFQPSASQRATGADTSDAACFSLAEPLPPDWWRLTSDPGHRPLTSLHQHDMTSQSRGLGASETAQETHRATLRWQAIRPLSSVGSVVSSRRHGGVTDSSHAIITGRKLEDSGLRGRKPFRFHGFNAKASLLNPKL